MVEIVRAGSERIDDLRPLWESLHHHHAEVAPHLEELGPLRTPAESWAIRRELYEGWLAEPGAFVLIAEANGRPVGYALVHYRTGEETWDTGDRIAELESLAVLPAERGRGLGASLIQRVHEELRGTGVRVLALGVISTNADARRFYEREGFLPFIATYLGRVPD